MLIFSPRFPFPVLGAELSQWPCAEHVARQPAQLLVSARQHRNLLPPGLGGTFLRLGLLGQLLSPASATSQAPGILPAAGGSAGTHCSQLPRPRPA